MANSGIKKKKKSREKKNAARYFFDRSGLLQLTLC